MGFLELSKKIDKIGLQFSIHRSNDEDRNKLIPYNSLILQTASLCATKSALHLLTTR